MVSFPRQNFWTMYIVVHATNNCPGSERISFSEERIICL